MIFVFLDFIDMRAILSMRVPPASGWATNAPHTDYG